jgi:fission process protein 1
MGWWGKSSDPKPEQQKEVQKEVQKESVFDPTLPKAEKLPKGLQKIVDKANNDEGFFDSIKEGR